MDYATNATSKTLNFYEFVTFFAIFLEFILQFGSRLCHSFTLPLLLVHQFVSKRFGKMAKRFAILPNGKPRRPTLKRVGH